jgi:Na+-driven multidrug efflux pump
VWLAASLLADSLAVAAQSLLARCLAAGDAPTARAVGDRTVTFALLLGVALAAGMGLAGAWFPAWFSRDAAVLSAAAGILPMVVSHPSLPAELDRPPPPLVSPRGAPPPALRMRLPNPCWRHTTHTPLQVLTQPLNALAFLMDGILYGAGGFGYAAVAMAAAALPALLVMRAGASLAGGDSAAQLLAVWAGLGSVMALRWLTIFVPYQLKLGPFRVFEADPEGKEAGDQPGAGS